jgi:PAS domain S-box-containing protein
VTGLPAGRRRIVLENQGLNAIAFFEATACLILLVLFTLFRRDHRSRYFRLWHAGWLLLTLSSFSELICLSWNYPPLRIAALTLRVAAYFLYLSSVMAYTAGRHKRYLAIWPMSVVLLLGVIYTERSSHVRYGSIHWMTSVVLCLISLWAGWMLWRFVHRSSGHGARLLAGVFLVSALNGMDRPLWPQSSLYLFRVAFEHLLGVALGIAMVVLVLEGARSRTEELNDKLRRLTLLTAASSQTRSVKEMLERVLKNLVESVGATHGIVRLLEGEGKSAQLVVRAAVGFEDSYLAAQQSVSVNELWVQRVLQKDPAVLRLQEEEDVQERERMATTGVQEIVCMTLRGKDGPLGIVAVGADRPAQFQPDEISYLANIANLLGMTLQNVRLFEQVDTIQRQWAYTFDSIGDPIFVHDGDYRILRLNQRLCQIMGRESNSIVGRWVSDLLLPKGANFKRCPYCEGVAGEGDEPDPWLHGYFLASNSNFSDPTGKQLGTVHVLKDITERKRAEEKYRTLVSNVKEGVFISTPQGRFLDFNNAFLDISGYDRREELLGVDIPALYVNPSDRERLKKLLNEHGSVADFEFEMRRKDGEVRTVMESSIAVRDSAGNVTAYQGFLLDITERKRAEQEIRRRNRELLVLNSIAQTLMEAMDLGDSLHRTLRQMSELFDLDASSLYLFDENNESLRRVAAVGHRSEYARHFPQTKVSPDLVHHLKAVHATFVSSQGLSLPSVFLDAQRKEKILSSYVVLLWSKDRVIGLLVVGSRTFREFSPADINLLIAVGSQIASAIERTLLYEQTRQAYEDLRRTQEQLLHSEKMAAVGQLISGVAHELNNPLTAILGYSQLLTASGQIGPQGVEYAEKLYKQAQRTHRIVQNLLSFSRQHKPERVPVKLNEVLEDTLALRDYDLRMSKIRVHLDFAGDLPAIAADPHQLQQVFLNLVNNAVDAILERSTEGDLWVRTEIQGDNLLVQFTDSGPGVKEPSRVFDPFYTTKPVGKGTGLGLSICYGIVTEHGGQIRVKNAPPRGASFAIELPCHQPAVPPEPESSKPLKKAARGGRVLLLDSDESVLEAVEAILRGRDHQVRVAKTLKDAQDLLELHEFDVILSDGGMNRKGPGVALRHWLLACRPHLAARVIWMRSGTPGNTPSRVSEDGNPVVLQKPLKAAELLAAVDSLLHSVDASAIQR